MFRMTGCLKRIAAGSPAAKRCFVADPGRLVRVKEQVVVETGTEACKAEYEEPCPYVPIGCEQGDGSHSHSTDADP